MNNLWIHPALLFFVGAPILLFLPERLRKAWLLIVPGLVFLRTLYLSNGTFGEVAFLDWTLIFGRVDKLSLIFGHIMALMAIIGTLYGLHVKRVVEHIAAWIYVGGSLGAIYAGDLLTLFLFWELMALSSVFLIWFRGRDESLGAGYRYLLVHMAGGVLLLAGILMHYQVTNSLAFITFDVQTPSWAMYLIMMGFLINAAVPPLHAWLPDAYSEATFNGSVFLCAFTTKTAVYALCRGMPGMEILVPLGVIMTIYGVIYAILENDSRRLLAFSQITSIGYMIVGVGLADLNTPIGKLAFNGAIAYAFAHILFKGLLFMGCGSVLHMTGESRFTHLGGLYARMPWTFVFTLMGAFSLSAFPLCSGFISKSMIIDAEFEHHDILLAFALLFASAGTFVVILKVLYFIWFGNNRCTSEVWQRAADPNWNMKTAMAFTSAACIFVGSYTPYLYNMLPFPASDYHPYTSIHITETLQILFFAALGFFLFIKKITPQPTISLDTDWFYRMGGQMFLWFARKRIQSVDNTVGEIYHRSGLIPLKQSAVYVGIFDNQVIDNIVDGIANSMLNIGNKLRSLQRGVLHENLIIAIAMMVIFTGMLFYFW